VTLLGRAGCASRLEAILAGKREGAELAKLVDVRVKKTPQEIAAASRRLSGSRVFVLAQELQSYRHVTPNRAM